MYRKYSYGLGCSVQFYAYLLSAPDSPSRGTKRRSSCWSVSVPWFAHLKASLGSNHVAIQGLGGLGCRVSGFKDLGFGF